MDFSLSRSAMLDLVALTIGVPFAKRSALLGRFQHLQRLKLIEGINPGRGKAAEYGAHQIVVILIAFQMLQLGLTPERTVSVIKGNAERIRKAIGLAVTYKAGEIGTSMIWFDPAVLSPSVEGFGDPAASTFDFADAAKGMEALMSFFILGEAQRAAFIGVSGTLKNVVGMLDDDYEQSGKTKIGEKGGAFMQSLRNWYESSEPESLL